MAENSMKPRIRFKGYTDAWEQRKLGEVANIQKGQQLGKAEMSNNGAFYVLNGGMEPSGYTNQYNTFANTISISEGGNSCGYVSLNLEQFWSGGHNYTLQNPKIDTFFLYQWLKRHEKGIMALRVGSGLPNIQKSALQDVNVAYPKKSEQRAIAEILNKIDNLITLHQRKDFSMRCGYDLFLKMVNTQKMVNAWEQRKFSDFFEERNERSGNGELISVTVGSGIKKFNELGRFDSKPEDMSNYKRVVEGDIAYNSMRMWQGASGYSPYTGILSPAYTVITPKYGVSAMFFSYVLKRPYMVHLFEINSQGLTSDTWNLKYPAFSQIDTIAPITNDEQNKIASIFSKIDNLITLHQRGLIKIQGDKNGKKRSFRRIVQRLFRTLDKSLQRRRN